MDAEIWEFFFQFYAMYFDYIHHFPTSPRSTSTPYSHNFGCACVCMCMYVSVCVYACVQLIKYNCVVKILFGMELSLEGREKHKVSALAEEILKI